MHDVRLGLSFWEVAALTVLGTLANPSRASDGYGRSAR
jgi:hypothetical protein